MQPSLLAVSPRPTSTISPQLAIDTKHLSGMRLQVTERALPHRYTLNVQFHLQGKTLWQRITCAIFGASREDQRASMNSAQQVHKNLREMLRTPTPACERKVDAKSDTQNASPPQPKVKLAKLHSYQDAELSSLLNKALAANSTDPQVILGELQKSKHLRDCQVALAFLARSSPEKAVEKMQGPVGVALMGGRHEESRNNFELTQAIYIALVAYAAPQAASEFPKIAHAQYDSKLINLNSTINSLSTEPKESKSFEGAVTERRAELNSLKKQLMVDGRLTGNHRVAIFQQWQALSHALAIEEHEVAYLKLAKSADLTALKQQFDALEQLKVNIQSDGLDKQLCDQRLARIAALQEKILTISANHFFESKDGDRFNNPAAKFRGALNQVEAQKPGQKAEYLRACMRLIPYMNDPAFSVRLAEHVATGKVSDLELITAITRGDTAQIDRLFPEAAWDELALKLKKAFSNAPKQAIDRQHLLRQLKREIAAPLSKELGFFQRIAQGLRGDRKDSMAAGELAKMITDIPMTASFVNFLKQVCPAEQLAKVDLMIANIAILEHTHSDGTFDVAAITEVLKNLGIVWSAEQTQAYIQQGFASQEAVERTKQQVVAFTAALSKARALDEALISASTRDPLEQVQENLHAQVLGTSSSSGFDVPSWFKTRIGNHDQKDKQMTDVLDQAEAKVSTLEKRKRALEQSYEERFGSDVSVAATLLAEKQNAEQQKKIAAAYAQMVLDSKKGPAPAGRACYLLTEVLRLIEEPNEQLRAGGSKDKKAERREKVIATRKELLERHLQELNGLEEAQLAPFGITQPLSIATVQQIQVPLKQLVQEINAINKLVEEREGLKNQGFGFGHKRIHSSAVTEQLKNLRLKIDSQINALVALIEQRLAEKNSAPTSSVLSFVSFGLIKTPEEIEAEKISAARETKNELETLTAQLSAAQKEFNQLSGQKYDVEEETFRPLVRQAMVSAALDVFGGLSTEQRRTQSASAYRTQIQEKLGAYGIDMTGILKRETELARLIKEEFAALLSGTMDAPVKQESKGIIATVTAKVRSQVSGTPSAEGAPAPSIEELVLRWQKQIPTTTYAKDIKGKVTAYLQGSELNPALRAVKVMSALQNQVANLQAGQELVVQFGTDRAMQLTQPRATTVATAGVQASVGAFQRSGNEILLRRTSNGTFQVFIMRGTEGGASIGASFMGLLRAEAASTASQAQGVLVEFDKDKGEDCADFLGKVATGTAGDPNEWRAQAIKAVTDNQLQVGGKMVAEFNPIGAVPMAGIAQQVLSNQGLGLGVSARAETGAALSVRHAQEYHVFGTRDIYETKVQVRAAVIGGWSTSTRASITPLSTSQIVEATAQSTSSRLAGEQEAEISYSENRQFVLDTAFGAVQPSTGMTVTAPLRGDHKNKEAMLERLLTDANLSDVQKNQLKKQLLDAAGANPEQTVAVRYLIDSEILTQVNHLRREKKDAQALLSDPKSYKPAGIVIFEQSTAAAQSDAQISRVTAFNRFLRFNGVITAHDFASVRNQVPVVAHDFSTSKGTLQK